ncbi:MAG: hypothetical protein ACXW27_05370 [Allosphingosinicella sp.]
MPRPVAILSIFGLLSTAAVQAAPRQGVDAPEKAAGNPDKVVCKRFLRVGSLVDGYRTCKTKREWERERDNLRQVNWSSPCKSAESGTCEPP